MTDSIHRHGKRMCRLLEQALDMFPADKCRVAAAALDGWHSDSVPELNAVFRGLAMELRLVALRAEQDAHECDGIMRATTEANTPDDVA